MRIGLLNMMPDKALLVTERQFAALCGLGSAADLQRFMLPDIGRGEEVIAHVVRHYLFASALADADLDVLVISGANVASPHLSDQIFWEPLCEVFALCWARRLPVLFSCLATHALLAAEHGEARRPVAPKISGVFDHDIQVPGHPLLAGVPDTVPVPHSRHNEMTAAQLERSGYTVLLASEEVGVHLAVSADGCRLLMQGHPEYESVSLLKEYKRDLGLWLSGELPAPPEAPAHYLSAAARNLIAGHVESAVRARENGAGPPTFPESELVPLLTAPWRGPARRIVANWLEGMARST